MEKTFRTYQPKQDYLFPRSLDEYVEQGDLSVFVRDLVLEQLDLSEVYEDYAENQGSPPYNPSMMVALILYAYAQGVYSSRRIARGCQQRVDFMAITAHERPNFRTVSIFRKRHLVALSNLFGQVLELCRQAGLVKLGHVALDGTKIKANASKHKAMSYGRMNEQQARLKRQVSEWFERAAREDQEEDRLYGADKRGDELPDWVANKEERIKRIEQAKQALEEQARRQASDEKPSENDSSPDDPPQPKLPPKNQSRKSSGEKHLPHKKDQYNFTDPESAIMKTRNGFEQSYNAQAAVDEKEQIIVAACLTNESNDLAQFAPLVEQIERNCKQLPEELSADAGYCSESNLALAERKKVNAYIPTGKDAKKRIVLASTPLTQNMQRKIARAGRRSRYRLRKQIVEPVFGQIKHARAFRQFLLRGLQNVELEWKLICTAHNLLKFASSRSP